MAALLIHPTATRLTPVKLYLLAYNAASALLWAHLLYITLSFLLASRSNLVLANKSGGASPTAWWNRLVASSPLARKLFSSLPQPLAAVERYLSGSYEYKNLGWWTKYTQTLAVLEVMHAALGWVRSPVITTASQVASRAYTVWGVVEAVPQVSGSAQGITCESILRAQALTWVVAGSFSGAARLQLGLWSALLTTPQTHSSPLFTTMLLAWSLTEVVRYTYYFTSLLSIRLPFLDWLRYTTFYPLYPLGAASEAFIAFSTLPSLSTLPLPDWVRNVSFNPLRTLITHLPDSLRKALVSTTWGRRVLWNLARMGVKSKVAKAMGREWAMVDYARLGLFAGWWPALWVLYAYMIGQRKKVLGKGKGKAVGGVNKAR